MAELKQRLDQVLEIARFTVHVTRPVGVRAEAFGAFSVESRRESEEELSPEELGELYERSKYAWIQPSTHAAPRLGSWPTPTRLPVIMALISARSSSFA